jgi:hypothetical protein
MSKWQLETLAELQMVMVTFRYLQTPEDVWWVIGACVKMLSTQYQPAIVRNCTRSLLGQSGVHFSSLEIHFASEIDY